VRQGTHITHVNFPKGHHAVTLELRMKGDGLSSKTVTMDVEYHTKHIVTT
jgi:hypothetical protein